MAGNQNETPPDFQEEANSANAGEPEAPDQNAPVGAAAAQDVNLDQRQSRISPERKPMGPPLATTAQPVAAANAAGQEETEVEPTDPEDIDPDELNAGA